MRRTPLELGFETAAGFDARGAGAVYSEAAAVKETNTSRILERLEALAENSECLSRGPLPLPDGSELARYIFLGPAGGGDPIRIGIFAGIHGDEPGGPEGVVKCCEELAARPELARGFNLFFYPVCNPAGFDAGSRYARGGKDLNREFWRGSAEPEVRALEAEITSRHFHGFISLHSDDTSHGMYGFIRGAVLAKSLLGPALAAAEQILPRNRDAIIDGFPAENGIISKCYDGILTAPPKLENTPFELILETPHAAPVDQQAKAFAACMRVILAEYRKFIAFAADL